MEKSTFYYAVKKLIKDHFFIVIFLLISAFVYPIIIYAATGEVQFSIAPQYQIGTAGSYFNNGNTIAKVFDGDLTSWWDANQSFANGSNVGLDLTVNAQVTKLWVAPRTGYTVRLHGAVFQGATVSSSTGPWTTIYTIPSYPPFYPQKQFSEIPINTGGLFYRYYRLVMPNGAYGSLGEMRLIGIASSTTPYVPVVPKISPMGGKFAQPVQVTITSSTTDAVIYYTNDGTTPTFSGGSPQGTTRLYTGPFMATTTATTTIKSIAVSANTYVSEVSNPAYFFINPAIRSGITWHDNNGNIIDAHTGGISYFNGKYYWYGESMNNISPELEKLGVNLYTSSDLVNWTSQGLVFNVNTSYILERPHVIYNATTSRYVMWARNVTNSRAIVATSSTPYGPFRVVTTSLNPDALGLNDLNLFKDTDGTAYIIYTSSDNSKMIISKLDSTYEGMSGVSNISAANANRSAPAMVKRNGVYFLLNSGQNSWTATTNKYSTSTSPLGTFSALVNPFQSSATEDNTIAYRSHTSGILTIQGRTEGYMYLGDRFDNSATASGSLYNSTYLFLPITFPTDNTMSISWNPGWTLDEAFTTSIPTQAATGLTATKNALTVNLSWTNNETNSYELYIDRATDNIFTENFISIRATTTISNFVDTDIVNDTRYYYRIRTVTAAGTSNSTTAIANFLLSADVTPPTGTVTSPVNGADLLGNVTLTATSSDDTSVSSVQFQVDNTNIGAVGTTSPYSIVWNSASIADGPHNIRVIVTDSSGNVGTSTDVLVNLINTQITVSANTPTIYQNSINNVITLTGNATSWTSGTPGSPTFGISGGTGAAITSQVVSSSTSANITVSAGSSTGTLRITAPDSGASTTITVLADTIPPTTAIVVPTASSTLTGSSVTLTASTSDNVRIGSVQFKIDTNTSIGASGTTSPYSISWNSTSVADGYHTISVVAADATGNVSTSTSIGVIVNNSMPATITTSAASSTTSFTAILNGNITNDGAASSTARGFQYGLNSAYGATTTETGLYPVGPYSLTVSGLSCATVYNFRAYTINLSGTSYGPNRTLTTATCPVATSTGEIQFSISPAYQFGTPGSYNNSGNVYSKVYDGNTSTWWDSQSANGSLVGLDLKAPAVVTRMKIAPRPGYTVQVYGAYLQGANVSSSTGPWTTIHTIQPYPPYYAQRQMSEIAIDAGGSAYRFYRLVMPDGNYGNLAEFRLIGNPGTTTPYTPVHPTASPNGGKYAQPIRVRLSSITTNASIYYTTDGSIPSVVDGVPQGTTVLYTAPFVLSASSTVQSIAISDGMFVSEVSPQSRYWFDIDFKPGQDWLDTDNHLIESHDGEIQFFNGKYYWYGQIFNANDPEIEAVGISCYSSSDLINWKDEGPVIYLGRSYMIERPHVLYNATTGKYVLWGHRVIASGKSTAVVAYNDTPYGAFTIASSSYNPDGFYLNDMNLFKDTDGSGYLLYSDGPNTHFVISKLSDDYLTTSGTYVRPNVLIGREGPQMILRNGVYFLLTSGLTGWAPNENKYSTSTSVMGNWSPLVNPFQVSVEEDRMIAYRSQTTDIEHIPGRGDAYIYIGDRFDYSNNLAGSLYNSRHVWLPLTFPTNNTMSISWNSSWNLDDVFPSVSLTPAATSLDATRGANQVDLTWTNNATTSHMLYVDRATNFLFTQNIVSDLVPEGTTTFTDPYISDGIDYYYRIRLVDASGTSNSNMASALAVVIPDTTDPVVSITSPTDLATVSGSSYSIAATATDNIAVAGVQFKLDNVNLGSEDTSSPYTISFDSTSVANGNYVVTAVARDSSNNYATTSVSITVSNIVPDITAPVISIVSPANAEVVSGNAVSIVASAVDNVSLAGVRFMIDGVYLGVEDVASPYFTSLNSTSYADGSYTVYAVARDSSNNFATTSVVITIYNPEPEIVTPVAAIVTAVNPHKAINFVRQLTSPFASLVPDPVTKAPTLKPLESSKNSKEVKASESGTSVVSKKATGLIGVVSSTKNDAGANKTAVKGNKGTISKVTSAIVVGTKTYFLKILKLLFGK